MFTLFRTKSRKTSSRKRSRKLSLESLESRKLLSITPTLLPTPSGYNNSYASAIDDSGQVAGYSAIPTSSSSGLPTYQACVWTNTGTATMPDWNVTALPTPPLNYSVANGINLVNGQTEVEVVGYCNNGSLNVPYVWTALASANLTVSASWTATALSPLQSGLPAGDGGQARAVNANGDVVGQAHYETSTGTVVLYACLWTPSDIANGGGPTNLGMASGGPTGFYAEVAYGINDSGEVVGYGEDSSGEVGFVYNYNSNGTMTDLGNYAAFAINDNGLVVGDNPSGGFVYNSSNGTTTSLGGNGGANAININGQVLGTYDGGPCLYQQVGTTWAVTYLGGSGIGANAINDSGEIAGVSANASGAPDATLWTSPPSANIAGTGYSYNWSGYAVNTANDAVTAVGGSWTVPTVTKTGSSTAYASVWVGIDGSTNSTVEQTGTDSIVSPNGSVTNYAWYEMYPSGSVEITRATSTSATHGRSNFVPATVKPGDSITASVTYIGSSDFTLTITDTTEAWTYSTTQRLQTAELASAEWIVEAPSGSRGELPLANFNTVTFSGCWATITGTTGPGATNPGTTETVRGPIDGSAIGYYNSDDVFVPYAGAPVDMVPSSTNPGNDDTTGPLTDTTTSPIASSFTVTYVGSTSGSSNSAATSGTAQSSLSGYDDAEGGSGYGSGQSETDALSQGLDSAQSSFQSALDVRDAVFASFDAHALV